MTTTLKILGGVGLTGLLLLGGFSTTYAQALGGSCTTADQQQGHYEGNECKPGAVAPATPGSPCTTSDVPPRSGTFAADGKTCNATAAAGGSDAAAKTPAAPGGSGLIAGAIIAVLNYIAVLLAWLVAVAAITLENVILHTVVHMGNYVNNLSAVGVTWRIFRDIGNIALLFGFVVLGLSVILDVAWYGGGYKFLPKLLMAAVAINFSLFAAEAVIDVGNLFATQFYTQINGGKPAQSTSYDGTETEGISNKLMSQMGLASIYGTALEPDGKVFEEGHSMTIAFLTIILFMIVAFVLFSLAFMLLARFVALVLIIISSPIGVAGLGIPKLEGLAKQWWSQLVSQTITAPVLLLLLYIALAVITDRNFITGFTGQENLPEWGGFMDGKNLAGFAGVLLSFFVAMGLLLAVMVAAKKMGAAGADWAMRMGGRLSFGAVSLLGSGTFGLAGRAMNMKRIQAAAPNSRAARYTSRFGKFLTNRTYDFRKVPGLQSTVSAVTSGLGSQVSLGKPVNRTLRQSEQDARKLWQEMGKESAAEEAKASHEIALKDAQYKVQDARRKRDSAEREKGRDGLTPEREAQIKKEIEGYNKTITDNEAVLAIELSKMTNKQIEELGAIKKDVDTLIRDGIVANLSPQQFEALLKSDKLSDQQKDNIKSARYYGFRNAVSDLKNAPDDKKEEKAAMVKKMLKDLSKGELEAMPADLLAQKEVLDLLNDKQREALTDSKERTKAEKKAVRDSSAVGKTEKAFDDAYDAEMAKIEASLKGMDDNARTKAIQDAREAAADSPKVQDLIMKNLNAQQMARLNKNILMTKAAAQHFNGEVLTKIEKDDVLMPSEMKKMGKIIMDSDADEKFKKSIQTGPRASSWGSGTAPARSKSKAKAKEKAEEKAKTSPSDGGEGPSAEPGPEQQTV